MASNRHHFTEEEKEFIKSIFDDCSSYNDLTKKFNEKFELNLKSYSLSDLCCKRMKLKRNKNNGKFKKGYNNQNKMPIGTEINKNGYIWIKVNDIHFEGKIDNKKYKINWMPKHKYIYEQHYGKIPEGYFVIFLYNNQMNFDVSNLYCVNRKIHVIMSKNKWYTNNKENTLTAIKWCELYYVLKNNKKNI